jgi:hypothetical protein
MTPARETVSIEMEKLAEKHLVTDNRRRITVRDVTHLEKEAFLGDAQFTDYSL